MILNFLKDRCCIEGGDSYFEPITSIGELAINPIPIEYQIPGLRQANNEILETGTQISDAKSFGITPNTNDYLIQVQEVKKF